MVRATVHSWVVPWRVVAASVALALLAGCGGDDATNDATGEAAGGPPGAVESLASVERVDAAVDAAAGEADFAAVEDDAADVDEGDQVRTDASGFAEITYFDGSIVRLDVDSTITISDLVDAVDASTIRSEMGTGRTYHRVNELTGDDTYEVETSVATATVRGTAFLVTCPDESTCTFDVLDGTVEVTPTTGDPVTVGSGQSVEVTVDDAGAPREIDQSVLEDEWVLRNTDRDSDAEFPAIDPPAGDNGPDDEEEGSATTAPDDDELFTEDEAGDIEGSYDFATTVTSGGGIGESGTLAIETECAEDGCEVAVLLEGFTYTGRRAGGKIVYEGVQIVGLGDEARVTFELTPDGSGGFTGTLHVLGAGQDSTADIVITPR